MPATAKQRFMTPNASGAPERRRVAAGVLVVATVCGGDGFGVNLCWGSGGGESGGIGRFFWGEDFSGKVGRKNDGGEMEKSNGVWERAACGSDRQMILDRRGMPSRYYFYRCITGED